LKLKLLTIRIKVFFKRFFSFLRANIEQKTYIILTSLVVGIAAGLAAVLLKHLVTFFQEEPAYFFDKLNIHIFPYVSPLIGIFLSVFIIRIFFKGKLIKGLAHLIYLILRRGSNIPKNKMISHLLTSGATVGMGGSAGLEAPIVITGAAIGSNIAKRLNFNYQTKTLLLACGSAAGISAIFNSPIAGVIFAFEVLLPEFSIPSLIPLLIASASAAVVSQLLYSGQLFFLVTEGYRVEAIPFYIILGILCGAVSLYMIKITFMIESRLNKINGSYKKALIGGLLLSFLIFLIPSLYGEGYRTIINLLAGRHDVIISKSILSGYIDRSLLLIIWAAVVILTKIIATTLTIGSGGNGGIIAPSLFTGAVTGFLLAEIINYAGVTVNYPNFIVVGMAGVLSGVLHSPLTAIFLIAEVTGGYILIVPLMIVAALSFFISRYYHSHSIYTAPLIEQGIKFRSEEEKYFLSKITLRDIVERDFAEVRPQMTLRELVGKIPKTKRNLFPVVDENKKLLGIVTLNDIKDVLLNTEVYDVILVYELMDTNFKSVDVETDMGKVLTIFKEKNVWNLAVTKDEKYFGFVSKSNIFNTYLTVWGQQQKDNI
jgi:chloride channel protein, CIC family